MEEGYRNREVGRIPHSEMGQTARTDLGLLFIYYFPADVKMLMLHLPPPLHGLLSPVLSQGRSRNPHV